MTNLLCFYNELYRSSGTVQQGIMEMGQVRMGRDATPWSAHDLLSYPDEPHHLGRRENQRDFRVRMKQFFDHYLKGSAAPVWMAHGVPFLQRGKDTVLWDDWQETRSW